MITSRSGARTLKLLLAASMVFVSSSAQAAEDTKLEQIVRNAKVIKSAFPLTVERKHPNEATVTTLLDPEALPNDCKIDAMLVARSLINADKSIEKVIYELKYSASDPGYDSILVRVSDVRAFGAKQISEQQLLTELDVDRHRAKPPAPATAPAPVKTAVTPEESGTDRPFLFTKSGDRDYAVRTPRGHRELAYVWLCSSAYFLDKMKERGQVATQSEEVFAKMQDYLKANDFASAHRQGGVFQKILTSESRNRTKVSAASHIDYQRLNQHYYAMLQKELGPETPPRGWYFVERCKPIIRIKELEENHVNTQSLRNLYKAAIAAYESKDYKGMMAKFVEMSNLFASKYKEL